MDDSSMDRGDRKHVNAFGQTAEQVNESVIAHAKQTIDEHIDNARSAGKQPDGTWGMRLTGSGNFQMDTYMPYLEIRKSDAAEAPDIVQLTIHPITQDQSQQISDHYFEKMRSLEN